MNRLRISVFVVAAALGTVASACVSSRTAEEGSCTTECERKPWPRLAVDVPAPSGARVEFVNEAGKVSAGLAGGCPESPVLSCTAAYFPGESERAVTVRVVLNDVTVDKRVELRSFNHCGREVGQVRVSLADGGPPVIAEPTYVDACPGTTTP